MVKGDVDAGSAVVFERRKPQFWHIFNDWWRSQFASNGNAKPRVCAITEWYASNAHLVWPENERPTLEEAKRHAKGLRPKGAIKDYFKKYRERVRKSGPQRKRYTIRVKGQAGGHESEAEDDQWDEEPVHPGTEEDEGHPGLLPGGSSISSGVGAPEDDGAHSSSPSADGAGDDQQPLGSSDDGGVSQEGHTATTRRRARHAAPSLHQQREAALLLPPMGSGSFGVLLAAAVGSHAGTAGGLGVGQQQQLLQPQASVAQKRPLTMMPSIDECGALDEHAPGVAGKPSKRARPAPSNSNLGLPAPPATAGSPKVPRPQQSASVNANTGAAVAPRSPTYSRAAHSASASVLGAKEAASRPLLSGLGKAPAGGVGGGAGTCSPRVMSALSGANKAASEAALEELRSFLQVTRQQQQQQGGGAPLAGAAAAASVTTAAAASATAGEAALSKPELSLPLLPPIPSLPAPPADLLTPAAASTNLSGLPALKLPKDTRPASPPALPQTAPGAALPTLDDLSATNAMFGGGAAAALNPAMLLGGFGGLGAGALGGFGGLGGFGSLGLGLGLGGFGGLGGGLGGLGMLQGLSGMTPMSQLSAALASLVGNDVAVKHEKDEGAAASKAGGRAAATAAEPSPAATAAAAAVVQTLAPAQLKALSEKLHTQVERLPQVLGHAFASPHATPLAAFLMMLNQAIAYTTATHQLASQVLSTSAGNGGAFNAEVLAQMQQAGALLNDLQCASMLRSYNDPLGSAAVAAAVAAAAASARASSSSIPQGGDDSAGEGSAHGAAAAAAAALPAAGRKLPGRYHEEVIDEEEEEMRDEQEVEEEEEESDEGAAYALSRLASAAALAGLAGEEDERDAAAATAMANARTTITARNPRV